MSIMKRGSRWVGRVYVGGGRYRWLGSFDTKREAKAAEARAQLERKRRRSDETCDEFAARWVGDYPRSRASTNQHNRERVKPFARDFASVKLSDVDRVMARAWAQANPQLARYARTLFEDARNDGLIDDNPFSNLRLPGSVGRRDDPIPTEREVTELADAALAVQGAYGPEMRATILFAAYVGLRAGELYALDWSEVDLAAGEVVIERSYASKTREMTLPKNGKPRTVILPPPAREALRSKPRRPDQEHVFAGKRGQRLSATTHFHLWNPVRASAGKPELDWHHLRHVAGSLRPSAD